MSALSEFLITEPAGALHQSTKDLLDQFEYEHLPEGLLRNTSESLCITAIMLVSELKSTSYGGELSTGLRKLLESKDCFVRAARGV